MIGRAGTSRRRAAATTPTSSLLPSEAMQTTDSKRSHMDREHSSALHLLYNRLASLVPEGLLRPYWWVYVLLTLGGLFATRRAASYYDSDSTRSSFATASEGSHNSTLALLYPPGLMGGYRNQVIRFIAFVVHAMENENTEILLPSLIWTTKEDQDQWVPVPHSLLFDVDFWNWKRQDLPRLVNYNEKVHTDWTVPTNNVQQHSNPLLAAVVQGGFLKPIASYAESIARGDLTVNARKIDLLPNVTQCTRPAVHGGGKGAGRLWWETMELNQKAEREGTFPFDASAKILKALIPKQEFRDVAMQCVKDGTSTAVARGNRQRIVPYIALHARVELEMMEHKCGRTMEKNLTKIFNMVDGIVDKKTKGVFLAVSRSGMEVQHGSGYVKFQDYVDENLDTLNWIVGTEDAGGDPMSRGEGLRHGAVPVFECGRSAIQRYYAAHPESPNFGSLLESMVNFHVATEATVFVGVRGSSYSTDIWATRYHLGRGSTNYEYTPSGLKRIENGGLPPPHKTC